VNSVEDANKMAKNKDLNQHQEVVLKSSSSMLTRAKNIPGTSQLKSKAAVDINQ
jgi:hypothetical protein